MPQRRSWQPGAWRPEKTTPIFCDEGTSLRPSNGLISTMGASTLLKNLWM